MNCTAVLWMLVVYMTCFGHSQDTLHHANETDNHTVNHTLHVQQLHQHSEEAIDEQSSSPPLFVSKTPNADRLRTPRQTTAAQLIENALLQVMQDDNGESGNGTTKKLVTKTEDTMIHFPKRRALTDVDCVAVNGSILWHSAVNAQCVAHENGALLEWPYDIYSSVYPCGLGPPPPDKNGTVIWDRVVHIVNTSEFLDEVSRARGRETNWCFLINLYTPYCPYSAQLAQTYNSLPRYFPSLYVVAIDARDFVRHQTTSRYGVAGTPTLMLWHNGRAVARYAGATHTLQSIHMFLTRWTDLQRDRRVVESIDDTYGPLPTEPVEETDYYLYFAIIFLLICGSYHGLKSTIAMRFYEMLLEIWREACETVDKEDNEQRPAGEETVEGDVGDEDRVSETSSDSYQDVLEPADYLLQNPQTSADATS